MRKSPSSVRAVPRFPRQAPKTPPPQEAQGYQTVCTRTSDQGDGVRSQFGRGIGRGDGLRLRSVARIAALRNSGCSPSGDCGQRVGEAPGAEAFAGWRFLSPRPGRVHRPLEQPPARRGSRSTTRGCFSCSRDPEQARDSAGRAGRVDRGDPGSAPTSTACELPAPDRPS